MDKPELVVDEGFAYPGVGFSMSGGRDDTRKDRADRATTELVLDQTTRQILLSFINKGLISELEGVISTGKEANVYTATLRSEDDSPIVHRAVKIYKTAILVFKDRDRYVEGEHRFKRGIQKSTHKKMIKVWAEKEYRNLLRLQTADIPSPKPFKIHQNVLLMDFLGKRGLAYPRLRDVQINGDDAEEIWTALYRQALGLMRRLYKVARLVHADLSEYNILYHDKKLYIIDVSQSVEHAHPRAMEFLRMDVKNVADFFRRKGVDTLLDQTMMNFITYREGPLDYGEMTQTIQQIYDSLPPPKDAASAAKEFEDENEAFRASEVQGTADTHEYTPEDAERYHRNYINDPFNGRMGELRVSDETNSEGYKSSNDESDDGARLEDEGSTSGDSQTEDWVKKTPRGKKFMDKDEKHAHKMQVKEEQRLKREAKMPKNEKKRLVALSSKKKT